jgi:BMFP domain-containing protein YqiC
MKTMKPRPDIFGDLATMANGAASALGSLREEFNTMKKGRKERGQNAAGIVTREEFDALMTRLEALAQRIAFLEAVQQAPQAKPKPATKRQAKAKKGS